MIICSWYTLDYSGWAERFRKSLEAQGAAYDFIQVDASNRRGWESITLMKASIAGQFMDRHEGRTVVLNDVDALAVSSLDHLGDIDCDIALKMTAKRLRGRFMLVPRSGTVVINPTKASRALVENWVSAAKDARYGDTDESALTKAMAETSGLRVTVLASPVSDCIRHDCASLVATKASHLKRAAAFALDPIRAFAGIARGSSPA